MATMIYSCKHCKKGRRVEYPEGNRHDGFYRVASSGERVGMGVWCSRSAWNGKPAQFAGDTEMGMCPQCHKMMKGEVLKGFFNPEHICDSRCRCARGGSCECSCGGKFHGADAGF